MNVFGILQAHIPGRYTYRETLTVAVSRSLLQITSNLISNFLHSIELDEKMVMNYYVRNLEGGLFQCPGLYLEILWNTMKILVYRTSCIRNIKYIF